MSKLFVFGLGYSAGAIASLVQRQGWSISVTVRSKRRFETVKERGISPVLFDDKEALRRALGLATHLLISVPPDAAGDPVLNAHGAALDHARDLKWIGYLSTIGVYGDHEGAWVDEDTPPNPVTGRGAARIEAENAWARFSRGRGLPLDVFRLSGIYGPGRSPLDRVREGRARRIVKPGQVFNRIHVEDIAQTVTAAMYQKQAPGSVRIFNVTDDEPAPPQDVIAYAAKLLGLSPPPEVPFESAGLSDMARSFYSDNKRVRNGKMKRELGVTPLYPTYREGLEALAKEL